MGGWKGGEFFFGNWAFFWWLWLWIRGEMCRVQTTIVYNGKINHTGRRGGEEQLLA